LEGHKMSKTKGIGVQPEKIIKEYGADALRFWAAGSKLGSDVDYQEKELITGRKFITKLFNASRFVFMNLKDYKGQEPRKLEKVDELFLKKIDILVKNTTYWFKTYEYSKSKFYVEYFFWKMFCDNYLEIIKKRIYQGKGQEKLSAQYTLYKSLLTILKLIAPIMPFITEEIYQKYFRKYEKDKSIHLNHWPKSKDVERGGHDKTLDEMFDVVSKVRQEKTRAKKPMNAECVITLPEKEQKILISVLKDLKNVTNASEIKEGKFKVEFVN